jgi:excisionase family DNA binding protein
MDASLHLPVPDELIKAVAERAAQLVVERSQPEAERWLTVREAAEHMALSVSQLYTLISQRRTNHIPVIEEGSRRYMKASALDRWREQQSPNGGPR